MTEDYRICERCIMDTSAIGIKFDDNGICNFCRGYDERARIELHHDEAGQNKLRLLIEDIKYKGKNKKYDCIIGVSGGLDSTMVAYTVKKFGLRPLAVHLDNGWDSELATGNIEKTLKALAIDLFTYIIDWEEFKDLQLSFLRASVANSEIPTDHAIVTLLYHTAAKYGLEYILTGGNIVSEAIMPEEWGYDSKDLRHIMAIHKRFGKAKLKTFPRMNLFNWVHYVFIKRIKYLPILHYIKYVRKDAAEFLEREIDWKDYGKKHYESIYTRFFQGYILPNKFRIDKRRAHLSTLISSGQITREDALKEMANPPYNEDQLKEDMTYVIKKFGLTKERFEQIMVERIKNFTDYPNNNFLFRRLDFFVKLAKKKTTGH